MPEEKMVKMFRNVLNPSRKLKTQLRTEIRKPENKKALEFIRSEEK